MSSEKPEEVKRANPELPRDKKTCLETSFLSLRQLSCLCRDRKLVSETTFPSQRQFFPSPETKKLVSETTFLSQRQVSCLCRFVVKNCLCNMHRDKFSQTCLCTCSENCYADVWISMLGPCPGPCSSNQPIRFLAHDPQPHMQATFFHLDSILCIMYRNLSKLDKATFQAYFLPPLLAVTVDNHMPQLSSL
jgi:hypothetical protein